MQQTQMGSTNAANLSRLANFHSTAQLHTLNGISDMNKAKTQTPGSSRRQEFVNSAYSHFDNADQSTADGNKAGVSGLSTPVSKPGMTDPGSN
jgi:hypothetical protein